MLLGTTTNSRDTHEQLNNDVLVFYLFIKNTTKQVFDYFNDTNYILALRYMDKFI